MRGWGGDTKEKKGRNTEKGEQRWKENIHRCKDDLTGCSQEEFKFQFNLQIRPRERRAFQPKKSPGYGALGRQQRLCGQAKGAEKPIKRECLEAQQIAYQTYLKNSKQ